MALMTTFTRSPALSPSSFSESVVMTDAISAGSVIVSATWDMTSPVLMSPTVAMIWLRAPYLIHRVNGARTPGSIDASLHLVAGVLELVARVLQLLLALAAQLLRLVGRIARLLARLVTQVLRLVPDLARGRLRLVRHVIDLVVDGHVVASCGRNKAIGVPRDAALTRGTRA